MSPDFWLKRLLLAFLVAAGLLFVVQMLKGYEPPSAAKFALFWGGVSSALFTLIGFIRYKRNPSCMIPAPRVARQRPRN